MCLCSYLLVLALKCASHPGLLNSEGSSTAYKSFHQVWTILLLLIGTEKKYTLLTVKYFGNKTFARCLTLGHRFLFCHFQVVPAETSEEETENSGDGAGAAALTHTSSPPPSQKKVVIWQDHFVRRWMSEPGTEFHEKGSWWLWYIWGVCGHGVIKFRNIQENGEKISLSVHRTNSWTWWLKLSGHLHYSVHWRPITRVIARLESVFMPTIAVNKTNLFKPQAIYFAFSMFPIPQLISEIFSPVWILPLSFLIMFHSVLTLWRDIYIGML